MAQESEAPLAAVCRDNEDRDRGNDEEHEYGQGALSAGRHAELRPVGDDRAEEHERDEDRRAGQRP